MEILRVSNIELKASNYSIKRFTVDYRKDLYDNRKYFCKRKDLHDRELSSLWCSKGRILIILFKDSFNLD